LNQVATWDFQATFDRYNFPHRSAREFRERYLIDLLKGRPA
jgi:hypothetical protein